MMWKFGHDQTNSHWVINKSLRVEECWSYISISKLVVVTYHLCNWENKAAWYGYSSASASISYSVVEVGIIGDDK